VNVDDMLKPGSEVQPTPENIGALLHEVRMLRKQCDDEGNGALQWIAALVHHAGGRVIISRKELEQAPNYGLERAEQGDGSVIIRTVRDREEVAAANDSKLLLMPPAGVPDLALPPNS